MAGGPGARRSIEDGPILDWIARASARARRTTSVCTGSYLLAAAGLLDGRRATTHWEYCDALAARFPAIRLEPDPVFVRDGDVWTSAGVTAGMDLALALVEDDLGPEVALAVAQLLVVFLKRPGGQSQFSGVLSVQQASRPALRELQAWIAGHLDEDLSGRGTRGPRASQRALVRPRAPGRGRQDPRGLCRAAPRRAGTGAARGRRRVGVGPSAYRERFRLAA